MTQNLSPANDSPYLDAKQLSRLLGLAYITLEKWRAKGAGPKYFLCGRSVRYKRSDVEAWVESQSRGTPAGA